LHKLPGAFSKSLKTPSSFINEGDGVFVCYVNRFWEKFFSQLSTQDCMPAQHFAFVVSFTYINALQFQ